MRRCYGCENPPDDRRWFDEFDGSSWCWNCTRRRSGSEEQGEMTASEALYGFMGWLTSREEESGPFAAHLEAADAATLVFEFCRANQLRDPRDGWHEHVVHPVLRTASRGDQR